jgi:hypothetical protein
MQTIAMINMFMFPPCLAFIDQLARLAGQAAATPRPGASAPESCGALYTDAPGMRISRGKTAHDRSQVRIAFVVF